jgi:hypothetical protein
VRAAFAAFMLIIAASAPTIATETTDPLLTGNHWHRVCLGTEEGFPGVIGIAACSSFVSGIDAANALLPKPFYCSPAGVMNVQLMRIAVKYLSDHPAELHEDFGKLVIRSLVDAYPCQDPAASLPRP